MTSQATGASPERLLAGLQASLHKLHESHPGSTGLLVAVSGGLDSMALLHACYRFCKNDADLFSGGIRAIHVNHGLSANADSWQNHCVECCAIINVPLVVERLQLRPGSGRSLEETAREARYEAFSRHLLRHEVLLLAHHRDDSAETVLLRLLRGAGPSGLAGIPLSRVLGEGLLWRPLLDIPKTALEAYACAAELVWVEDESNTDIRHSRNFLRHLIAPRLREHWPSWETSVLRSSAHCADADELLQELAEALLEQLSEGLTDRLCWVTLSLMSAARQRLLLRFWLQRATEETPGWQLVQRIMDEMFSAAVDAQPRIHWGQWVIRRYREWLFLMPEADAQSTAFAEQPPGWPAEGLSWSKLADGGLGTLVLPGNGTVRLHPVTESGMCRPEGDCRIRYRLGGERVALAGRPRRALKKILQEAGIPPWIRARTPLLYINGQLAWISGVGVCEGFAADGAGWAVNWKAL